MINLNADSDFNIEDEIFELMDLMSEDENAKTGAPHTL